MNKFNPKTSYASYSRYHHGTRDENGHFVKKMTLDEYVQAYSNLYKDAGESTRHNMPITLAGKRRPLTVQN